MGRRCQSHKDEKSNLASQQSSTVICGTPGTRGYRRTDLHQRFGVRVHECRFCLLILVHKDDGTEETNARQSSLHSPCEAQRPEMSTSDWTVSVCCLRAPSWTHPVRTNTWAAINSTARRFCPLELLLLLSQQQLLHTRGHDRDSVTTA